MRPLTSPPPIAGLTGTLATESTTPGRHDADLVDPQSLSSFSSFSSGFTRAAMAPPVPQQPFDDSASAHARLEAANTLLALSRHPLSGKRAPDREDSATAAKLMRADVHVQVPNVTEALPVSGTLCAVMSDDDGFASDASLTCALDKLSREAEAPAEYARIATFLDTADFQTAQRGLDALIRLHGERQSSAHWERIFRGLQSLSVEFEARVIDVECAARQVDDDASAEEVTDDVTRQTDEQFRSLLEKRLAFIGQMPDVDHREHWGRMLDHLVESPSLLNGQTQPLMAQAIDSFDPNNRTAAWLRLLDAATQAQTLFADGDLIDLALGKSSASERVVLADAALPVAIQSSHPADLIGTIEAICRHIYAMPTDDARRLTAQLADMASLHGEYDDLDLEYSECLDLLDQLEEASAADSRRYPRPDFVTLQRETRAAEAAFLTRLNSEAAIAVHGQENLHRGRSESSDNRDDRDRESRGTSTALRARNA